MADWSSSSFPSLISSFSLEDALLPFVNTWDAPLKRLLKKLIFFDTSILLIEREEIYIQVHMGYHFQVGFTYWAAISASVRAHCHIVFLLSAIFLGKVSTVASSWYAYCVDFLSYFYFLDQLSQTIITFHKTTKG